MWAAVSEVGLSASVSSIGYLGFMIGPPIIGGIAHATTLSMAMGTLIVALAILAIGSRRVPTGQTMVTLASTPVQGAGPELTG